MLFPYHTESPLTPAAVKLQREHLKEWERQHFAEYVVFDLIDNRTQFYDLLLKQLWWQFGLECSTLTLIATGGYGRREMFPLSDLDFLILSEGTRDEQTEEKIAQFVQFLWDCGFDVGHSVRSLVECEREGKQDITIATNLLESRYLSGNSALFTALQALLKSADFWSMADFFNAKVQEQLERYQRYHNTGYNLEPDLKYSPGGLRDLHLLYWIALRHTGEMTLTGILQSGFIYPTEYQQLLESQEFLFKVRFALHLILKRYDNRLLFDRQIKVAQLLGFEEEGNRGVETMMKRFFQALSCISRLSDILIKHYREHFLTRHYDLLIEYLDEDFQLINHNLCLRKPQVLCKQPERILDLFFYLTQYPQAQIHPETLRQLQIALDSLTIKLSELPLAREKFIRLFNQPQAIRRAFLPMHQYGVLSAYLPQWQAIAGLMQFDLFHIYTVDEHTLQVMLKLENLLSENAVQEHPIAHRIFSQLQDRSLIYSAALFHDIAKGRGGDHAELGAEDIAEFAVLHGFDARESDTMQWLVRAHLLMSVTAQRRDIYDPEVVLDFAGKVKNRVRLDYLTCLTIADICATNGTLWNSWKRSLFTALYDATAEQLQQGMEWQWDNAERIAENRQGALAILQQEQSHLSLATIDDLWARCPDEYFLRNSAKQIAGHTALLADFTGDVLVKITNRFSSGGTEVFVYCHDQARLFNKVVSTIGTKNLSIHDAQILTSDDGYVFDSFIITELNGELVKFDRRRDLEQTLTAVLEGGKVPSPPFVPSRQLRHFQVQTDVRFLKENKPEHTELELVALDKPGLLAQISQIFADLALNLRNAKITTVGEKAEDFFILTNAQGQALSAEERQQLADVLYRALD